MIYADPVFFRDGKVLGLKVGGLLGFARFEPNLKITFLGFRFEAILSQR